MFGFQSRTLVRRETEARQQNKQTSIQPRFLQVSSRQGAKSSFSRPGVH
jgi:hypothetical protein